ncbi:helix-hairpin-helix domain-containing protein [Paracrocinitomix mangrovi]|uniref:ComEA family DNA-binding protein n=1 Tax=Paracrocinitomix mangrovi TaxID=2862509 RepID=UPI001C8DFE8B|nr:helix-hairpin-helix domain-containing protein [Paracrocinitomix mangrovi]UKN01019.1 helix-hairpin-helix domain-containing protein [Paracrocinitomix mangrovi]
MKSYFHFTRKQKVGVVSISIIIVFLIVVLNVNKSQGLPDADVIPISEADFIQIKGDNHLDTLEANSEFTKDKSKSKTTYKLSKFDPNLLDQKGWEGIGFSDKQAKSIVDYRDKYGPFVKAEDVEKIYVISEDKFKEIEPYMILDGADPVSDIPNSILINSCNSTDLEALKGIGPFYAERIIKYRDFLGGFVSKDQFNEVYGLSELAIESLSLTAEFDLNQIKKININEDKKEDIRKHPYFKENWGAVAEIIKRRSESKIENLDFLEEKGLMSKSEIEKVSPYISY